MAQVKAGARTARPISINHGDDTYEIVPNGADSTFVDVPDVVVKTKFVQNLIETGDLVVKGYVEPSEEDEELAQLREEAQSMGLKIDKRWKADRLQQEIDQAKAPKAE